MKFLFCIVLMAAGEFFAHAQESSPEDQQRETIQYGTETEISALIQVLKNENSVYLDEDLALLMQTTENAAIMTGIWAFFGDREKSGLEERALQTIDSYQDTANEIVIAAIEYLGKMKNPDAVEPLKNLLDTGDRAFMNVSFRALGKVSAAAPDETALYLMDYYTNRNPGDENRRDLISAIGETGSSESISFLSDIATNNEERPLLRTAALEALSKLGDSSGLDAVLSAVNASDPTVRASAIAALGPFSGDRVDSIILEGFRDSFYRTRIAAATAAGERQLESAIPYLKYRAERDEVPAVKDESIRALAAINNAESNEIIGSLFEARRNPERVRVIAAEMLLKNNPDFYTQKIVDELDEAKRARLTSLYNGLRRVLGQAVTPELEALARRFITTGPADERSIGLDMVVNNHFTSLESELQLLTQDKNASLARKALRTLEQLGISPAKPESDSETLASPEENPE
ncbi:PBS lyase [Spirochaetia bacterium]|nr:PBS lyase [Spirochaetia bacterium]GHU30619.1 PBS lyase [Spirochaetia bacterium]